jgi:hypothetical protein
MVASAQARKSGSTAAQEIVKEEGDKLPEEVETEVLPDERERRFRTPGFHRMRTEWRGDDALVQVQVELAVEQRVMVDWIDAYQVMNQVYDIVRTPERDPDTGMPKKDKYGYIIWQRTAVGGYDEDFSRLTHTHRENFMFVITTRMFEWEQRKERAWLESMLAKAQWEERFAIAFDAPISGTVDDRKAAGNKDAADERYFAIFVAGYSRRCEAIVRSMNLLGQRIRDAMTA